MKDLFALTTPAELLTLMALCLCLLNLLAPFFIWVNVRGLRRENRDQLQRLNELTEALLEQGAITGERGLRPDKS